MKLFVPRGADSDETRVALTPRVAGALVADGVGVLFEAGIGAGALLSDADFVEAGATVVDDVGGAWDTADVVVTLSVQPCFDPLRGTCFPCSPLPSRRLTC